MIPYASIWQSKEPPEHSIMVCMRYDYYEIPKYFCIQTDGNGRSKLLSEAFITTYYEMKEKK